MNILNRQITSKEAMAVRFVCAAIAVIILAANCKSTYKSSTLEFSDAVGNSLEETSLSEDASLRDVIMMAENMRNGKMEVGIIRKMGSGTTKQVALVRQILIEEKLLHASRNISKSTSSFENAYYPIELLVHQHLIDEMMILLDVLFTTQKSIVVFTDESNHGEIAITRILQRCLETNRRIASFKTVSLKTTREAILKHMKSDLFVMDCDGKIAKKLLHFAKEMGYTGYRENVNWVLSHRTMTSLPMSCSLPLTKIFGIQAVFGANDGINDLMQSDHCHNLKNYENKVECRRSQYKIKDVIVKQLWQSPSRKNGQVWITIKTAADKSILDQSSQYRIIPHLNPLWPRFKVVVGDTFHPWIQIVDFSKTIPDLPLCGISGKYGHRYKNKTSDVTVPICAYGLAVDVIRHLEGTLEINCDVYVSRDGLYGSYDESTGKASGIIKEISSGAADFAVDMIEDTARRKAVEFTTPYEVTHYGIAYVYNHQHMRSGVFSPFSGSLWLAIFAVFFGIILFLWVFEKTSCIQKSRPTSECREAFNMFDSMEYIWGTMSHGEIILNKPIGVGGRLMSVFASFSLIAVVACYSAELISSFVVTDDTPLITGLKDILRYGDKVGTQRATATSNYLQNHPKIRVRQMFAKMQIFNTYQQSVDALRSGKIKFFVADFLTLSRTAQMDRNCTFHVVKADSNFAYLGMCFQRGSPLQRKLNLAAAGFTNSGKKDGMFAFWFGSGKCQKSNDFYPLELSHFKKLFIFVSFGLLASVSILIISLCWRCVGKYRLYYIER